MLWEVYVSEVQPSAFVAVKSTYDVSEIDSSHSSTLGINKNQVVNELRQAEINRIFVDQAEVYEVTRPMIDNGYGTMVPDLASTKTYVERGPARIVAKSDPILRSSDRRAAYTQSSGLTEAYGIGNDYVILLPYDATWLVSGTVFQYRDRFYKAFQ